MFRSGSTSSTDTASDTTPKPPRTWAPEPSDSERYDFYADSARPQRPPLQYSPRSNPWPKEASEKTKLAPAARARESESRKSRQKIAAIETRRILENTKLSQLVVDTEAQATAAQQEANLYKLQLEQARLEIDRAHSYLKAIEAQRDESDRSAAKARQIARRYRDEKDIVVAREQGRRLGFEEGLRSGRMLALAYEQKRLLQYQAAQRALPLRPAVVGDGTAFIEEADEGTNSSESHRTSSQRGGRSRNVPAQQPQEPRRPRHQSLDSSHSRPVVREERAAEATVSPPRNPEFSYRQSMPAPRTEPPREWVPREEADLPRSVETPPRSAQYEPAPRERRDSQRSRKSAPTPPSPVREEYIPRNEVPMRMPLSPPRREYQPPEPLPPVQEEPAPPVANEHYATRDIPAPSAAPQGEPPAPADPTPPPVKPGPLPYYRMPAPPPLPQTIVAPQTTMWRDHYPALYQNTASEASLQDSHSPAAVPIPPPQVQFGVPPGRTRSDPEILNSPTSQSTGISSLLDTHLVSFPSANGRPSGRLNRQLSVIHEDANSQRTNPREPLTPSVREPAPVTDRVQEWRNSTSFDEPPPVPGNASDQGSSMYLRPPLRNGHSSDSLYSDPKHSSSSSTIEVHIVPPSRPSSFIDPSSSNAAGFLSPNHTPRLISPAPGPDDAPVVPAHPDEPQERPPPQPQGLRFPMSDMQPAYRDAASKPEFQRPRPALRHTGPRFGSLSPSEPQPSIGRPGATPVPQPPMGPAMGPPMGPPVGSMSPYRGARPLWPAGGLPPVSPVVPGEVLNTLPPGFVPMAVTPHGSSRPMELAPESGLSPHPAQSPASPFPPGFVPQSMTPISGGQPVALPASASWGTTPVPAGFGDAAGYGASSPSSSLGSVRTTGRHASLYAGLTPRRSTDNLPAIPIPPRTPSASSTGSYPDPQLHQPPPFIPPPPSPSSSDSSDASDFDETTKTNTQLNSTSYWGGTPAYGQIPPSSLYRN